MLRALLLRTLNPEFLDLRIDLAALAQDITTRFDRLENLIVTTAKELAAEFDAATNDVAVELTALRGKLTDAVASGDAKAQAAVAAVLVEFDAPLARLKALGADPADPVPATEPTSPNETPVVDEPTDEGSPADEARNT